MDWASIHSEFSQTMKQSENASTINIRGRSNWRLYPQMAHHQSSIWQHEKTRLLKQLFQSIREPSFMMLNIVMFRSRSLETQNNYFENNANIIGFNAIHECKQYKSRRGTDFNWEPEGKVLLDSIKSKYSIVDIVPDIRIISWVRWRKFSQCSTILSMQMLSTLSETPCLLLR